MDMKTNITDDMDVWLADNGKSNSAYSLIERASELLDELRGELASARAELESARDDLREHQASLREEDTSDVEIAVCEFLDCVQRQVGTLAPAVPDTPASRRAIVALYDAVNRNL